MVLDSALLVMMFASIGVMLITTITDRMLFYYKKTPGRGYAQMAKPKVSKKLISVYSALELIGFFGFCISIAILAWKLD